MKLFFTYLVAVLFAFSANAQSNDNIDISTQVEFETSFDITFQESSLAIKSNQSSNEVQFSNELDEVEDFKAKPYKSGKSFIPSSAFLSPKTEEINLPVYAKNVTSHVPLYILLEVFRI